MNEREYEFKYLNEEVHRLDQILVQELPEYSRNYFQKLIKDGRVSVNGMVAKKAGMLVNYSSEISIKVPNVTDSNLQPENIPLEILFENSDVIVVNKKSGMVVHPSIGHESGTMVNALLWHSPKMGGIGGERRPGVVHRLDKGTSGLIIFAKNDKALNFLQTQFQERHVKKKYVALVEGTPPTSVGKIETAIGRDPKNRQKMAVVQENKGKLAISQYQILESFEKYSLLDVDIFTGRTHQIRVHLSFLGCPIVGDTIYGFTHSSPLVDRLFLHSSQLSIILPDEVNPRIFKSNLPEKLEMVLEKIRR